MPEGDKVMLVLNSDLKYSSLALGFHFIVCFPWRSKVSGTESHKARHSSVLTLERFQGCTNWSDEVAALLGKYQWISFLNLWVVYQISRLKTTNFYYVLHTIIECPNNML